MCDAHGGRPANAPSPAGCTPPPLPSATPRAPPCPLCCAAPVGAPAPHAPSPAGSDEGGPMAPWRSRSGTCDARSCSLPVSFESAAATPGCPVSPASLPDLPCVGWRTPCTSPFSGAPLPAMPHPLATRSGAPSSAPLRSAATSARGAPSSSPARNAASAPMNPSRGRDLAGTPSEEPSAGCCCTR